MPETYFIFRLVEGPHTRHRKLYLLEGGAWGYARSKALRGGLRRMQGLARSLKDGFPYLIIEKSEGPSSRPKPAHRG